MARKISWEEALGKYERAQKLKEASIPRAERRKRKKFEKVNKFLKMLKSRGGYYKQKEERGD